MMMMKRLTAVAFASFFAAATGRTGEFDRVDGDVLRRIVQGNDAKPARSLGLRELDSLPAAFHDTRAAFVVVKTGLGNYTRMLLTPALRKAADGDVPEVPVLVLERFDTFEPGKAGSRVARGVGVILFEGFQIDLDTGQIVPPGQGGDLEYRKEDKQGPELRVVGKSTIFALSRPVALSAAPSGPSPGRAVIPGDFGGRYHLYADGRWNGRLELEPGQGRQLHGRFRSEPGGTSYPVAGEVSPEVTNKASFTIKFPRTEQVYEAYLWTEGKNALAGSFQMLDRRFGFVAVREGVRLEHAD
jgi:hypothetical protein